MKQQLPQQLGREGDGAAVSMCRVSAGALLPEGRVVGCFPRINGMKTPAQSRRRLPAKRQPDRLYPPPTTTPARLCVGLPSLPCTHCTLVLFAAVSEAHVPAPGPCAAPLRGSGRPVQPAAATNNTQRERQKKKKKKSPPLDAPSTSACAQTPHNRHMPRTTNTSPSTSTQTGTTQSPVPRR